MALELLLQIFDCRLLWQVQSGEWTGVTADHVDGEAAHRKDRGQRGRGRVATERMWDSGLSGTVRPTVVVSVAGGIS